MNRTAPRVVGGVVLLEIFVIIFLLIFRTCCPADLDRFASASEGAELVLFQQPTDVGPNPFLDVPDRTRAGKMGEIALTEDADGGEVGTYGGTTENTCDPALLKEFLTEINPAKGKAWATAQGIAFSEIESFIDGLTPAVLQEDTYITNYGYDGGLTSNASVLAKGTAVLTDDEGQPVVRCMCGNPIKKKPQAPPPEYECVLTKDSRRIVDEPDSGYKIVGGPTGAVGVPITLVAFVPATIESPTYATVSWPGQSNIDVTITGLDGNCLPPQTLCVAFSPAPFVLGVAPVSGTVPVGSIVTTTPTVTTQNGTGYVFADWVTKDGAAGSGAVDISAAIDVSVAPPENTCLPSGDCTVVVDSVVTDQANGQPVDVAAGTVVNILSYEYGGEALAIVMGDFGATGPIPATALGGDCLAITEVQLCVADGPVPFIDPPAGQVDVDLGPNQIVTVTGGIQEAGSSQWIGVTWTDATGTYAGFARSDGLFPLDDCVPPVCSGALTVTLTEGVEATDVTALVDAASVTFDGIYTITYDAVDVTLTDGSSARVPIADWVALGCPFPPFTVCTGEQLDDFDGTFLIESNQVVAATAFDPATGTYAVQNLAGTNAPALPGQLLAESECSPPPTEVIESTTTVPESTTTTATTLPARPDPVIESTTTSSSTTTTTATTIGTTLPPAPCETSSDFHSAPAGATAYLYAGGGWYVVQITGRIEQDETGSGRDMISATTVFAGTTEVGWVYLDSLRGNCPGAG